MMDLLKIKLVLKILPLAFKDFFYPTIFGKDFSVIFLSNANFLDFRESTYSKKKLLVALIRIYTRLCRTHHNTNF